MAIKNKRLISWNKEKKIVIFEVNDQRYTVQLLSSPEDNKMVLYFLRERQTVILEKIVTKNQKRTDQKSFNPHLISPLDGMVIAVKVVIGQQVKKKDPLVIIEAMKMENILYTTHDAIIKNLLIAVGNVVHQHQLLMVLEKEGD